MLKDSDNLRPEEILFEVGYSIKCGEIEEKGQKEKKRIDVTCHDIIDVSKWVIEEMKDLNIKRIQKVYNYLEEQIQKQYEIDVAGGAKELTDLDALALITPERRK